MGMDVIGKAPESEEGAYFRNNIWWWHPLATYIETVAPDATVDYEAWHHNEGAGLDAEDAVALADKLQAEIDSGRCEQYMLSRGEEGVPNTENPSTVDMIKKVVGAIVGEETATEIGVDKIGESPWPFSADNVKGFIAFLRESGGFEIH